MLRTLHLVATSLACVVMVIAGQAVAQTVQLNYNAATVLGTVQIAGGNIDLTNGALIVTTSSFGFVPQGGEQNEILQNGVGVAEYGTAAVHDAIQEGADYNAVTSSAGFWSGTNGIMSTTAANNASGLLAVGYADNSVLQYNTFFGQQLDNVNYSQTIFATTYYGDANLDGHVDSADYDLLLGTITSGQPKISTLTGGPVEWVDGDFNGDGVVDAADYDLLLATITSGHNGNLGFNPSAVGVSSAGVHSAGVQAVPEPSSFGLLGIFLLCGFISRMIKVSTMSCRQVVRLVGILTVVTTAILFAAQSANATLYIDIQANPSDPGYNAASPRTLDVTSANETFTVDVYAVVATASPNPATDGIASLWDAFYVASSTLKGDVSFGSWATSGPGQINPPVSTIPTQFSTTYGALGIGGTSSTDTTNSHWWVASTLATPAFNGSPFVVNGTTVGTDYFLGTLTVTFTGYTLPTTTTSASMVADPRWGKGTTKPFNWNEAGTNYVTYGSAALIGGGPSSTNMLYSNASAGITPMSFVFSGGPPPVGVVGNATLSALSVPPAGVLQGATAPVTFTLTNTGSVAGQDTISYGVSGTAPAGALSSVTGSGLAPSSGTTTSLTYSAPPVGGGYGWETLTLTATGTGPTGTATPSSGTVNINVIGQAAANGTSFGTGINSNPVSPGGSYGGITSQIGNGGGSILNSNATILAGVNGASSTTISMAWRNRTAAEVAGSGGPQLVSDVVQLTGISPTTTPYALQMSFDPTLVGPNGASSVPSAASNGFIYLVAQDAQQPVGQCRQPRHRRNGPDHELPGQLGTVHRAR